MIDNRFKVGQQVESNGQPFKDGKGGEAVIERIIKGIYKLRRSDGKPGYAISADIRKR